MSPIGLMGIDDVAPNGNRLFAAVGFVIVVVEVGPPNPNGLAVIFDDVGAGTVPNADVVDVGGIYANPLVAIGGAEVVGLLVDPKENEGVGAALAILSVG